VPDQPQNVTLPALVEHPDRLVQKRGRFRRQLGSQATPLHSPAIPATPTTPAIPVHENDRGAVLAVSRAAIALGYSTIGGSFDEFCPA